jgi:hypothetical protein
MSRFCALTVCSLAILLRVSCEPALGENHGPYVGATSRISVPNVDNEDLNAKLQSLGFVSASTSTGARNKFRGVYPVFDRVDDLASFGPRPWHAD